VASKVGGAGGRGKALAIGIATSAAILLAADCRLIPALRPIPRDVWLMGFAADQAAVEGIPLNALGFTGDLPGAERSPGGLRVLTLGGSVLFNRRFTERFREQLAARVDGRVEVLGAALRAHTSRSSLLKWRLLARHGFDVVVIYEGINDLYANHVEPDRYRDDYAHLGAWYVRGPLLDRSVIARLVYNRWLHRPERGVAMASGFRSVETLRANLTELVRSVRAAGATPVLASFAWSIPPDYSRAAFERGALGYDNPERYDAVPVEYWGPSEWVREGLVRTNVAIHEVAGATGAPLFDAERVLGSDPRWFGDVCHPSDAGVERLIDELVEFVAGERALASR
jgi:lysophospholipase L1-like esterase